MIGYKFVGSPDDTCDRLLVIGESDEHSHVFDVATDVAQGAVDGVYPEAGLGDVELLIDGGFGG